MTKGIESAGAVPDHATVTIHYSLFLEGLDEPFDSTVLRGQAERYKLDDGRLLPGLELAIKSMKLKERSEFLIEPYLAYGSSGCPPRIPANSQVLASVELLHFVCEAEAESLCSLNPEDRKKTFEQLEVIAKRENNDGKHYFKEGEYKAAAKRFKLNII